MPFPVSYSRAEAIAERARAYYRGDALSFTPREVGHDGWFVLVSKEGVEGGLLFHIAELDNGAAGFREVALGRINAFRDGVAWEEPEAKPGLRYDDVMTTRSL